MLSPTCLKSLHADIAGKRMAARPYHIVVWGATGFTGKLVCEHLAAGYQGRVRWAMAGRSREKLEQVRNDLVSLHPNCKDVPLLIADAHDPPSIGRVVSQAQVVIAMAGPFAVLGDAVVDQALEHGTHYCDITGETPWVRRSIKKRHAAAKAKGVKIVGYDSIPSDLGTLMMVDYARKKHNRGVSQVYSLPGASGGGAPGGTIASVVNMVTTEDMSTLKEMGSNAYFLADAVEKVRGTDRPAPFRPSYLPAPGVWSAPWVMEGINARIVQLSNTLTPGHYGADFKIREAMPTGRGVLGFIGACIVTVLMSLFGLVLTLPPLRVVALRFLPKVGSGPSVKVMKSSSWVNNMTAVTEGPDPITLRGFGSDPHGDAGCWSTSRMILEAALCLVEDEAKLKAAGMANGGVLTPATAMGMTLIDRLRAVGQRWEVLGDGQEGLVAKGEVIQDARKLK